MVEDLRQRIPGLMRNALSIFGGLVILLALANILFLVLVNLLAGGTNPYFGVLTYMILPGILLAGIGLVVAGVLWERWRRRKLQPDQIPAYPRLDLNNPRQRNALVFFGSFFFVFLFLSAVGSYHAYEFTDSTQFCGQLCHNVMAPEFTAYSNSPHARVPCVDCHVGPGASWYVRSKMSGLRQVYAATFNKFPRPIPTPVENLRPAQQTCEQCHWPEKFHGAQLMTINHYGSDEKNTPRQIKLLIKTGGGSPVTGLTTGIHWHMNIANEITYIAGDKQRQTIPWVRMKDMQGRVTEYQLKGSELTAEQIAKAEKKRRMDCVDCHNRPTHIYNPPDRSVDDLLTSGKLDITLPFIKKYAVEVLTKEYKTTQEAMEGIATELDRAYLTQHKDVYDRKQAAVKQAIAEVQRVFRTNIFPEMRLDWRTHPNNIGHFYSTGCFRCHDGNHASRDGQVISAKCDICHTLLGQSEGGSPMAQVTGAAFQHPGGELPEGTPCAECHTGGVGP